MVCNRATSPSTSQRGQLPSPRNKSSLQPDLLEFNLASRREKSSYQTCFRQTKLKFIIGKAQRVTLCAKTYFLDRMCHLLHVKTAAPIIFYVNPRAGGQAQRSCFRASTAVNAPGKQSCSLDCHIPATVPRFFSCRVIARLLLWAFSCHSG